MNDPVEITKKLKSMFKNCSVIEFVGEWQGHPIYRISKIPLEQIVGTVQGGPDFIVINLEDFGESEIRPWYDPDLIHFHEIAWEMHPELWDL